MSLSFSKDILHKPVVDAEGKRRGVVLDLVVTLEERPPRILHLLVGSPLRGTTFALALPWRQVAAIEARAVRLHDLDGACPAALVPMEVLLKRDILDQQIVDKEGYKYLRVNDIALLEETETLTVQGVETGLQGFLLRLGSWRRLPALFRLLGLAPVSHLIGWEWIAGVDRQHHYVRLLVSRHELTQSLSA